MESNWGWLETKQKKAGAGGIYRIVDGLSWVCLDEYYNLGRLDLMCIKINPCERKWWTVGRNYQGMGLRIIIVIIIFSRNSFQGRRCVCRLPTATSQLLAVARPRVQEA